VQTFEGGVGTDFQLRRYNTAPGPEIQNGGPTGNFLRLIHDVGNQSSTIGLDQSPLLAAPTGELVAEFDYRMPDETGYTGSERADGFGFALLETSAWGTEGPAPNSGSQSDSHDPSLPINWERPRWHDALGIGFDLYNNNNENTVSLNWDGLEIATNYIDPNTFLLNNSLFNHVTVTALANDGGALVTVVITPDIHGTPGTPIVVFDNVPVAGMDLTTMSFRGGFGGRTGGQRTYVDLDNINIVPEPSSLVLLLLAVMGLVTLRRR